MFLFYLLLTPWNHMHLDTSEEISTSFNVRVFAISRCNEHDYINLIHVLRSDQKNLNLCKNCHHWINYIHKFFMYTAFRSLQFQVLNDKFCQSLLHRLVVKSPNRLTQIVECCICVSVQSQRLKHIIYSIALSYLCFIFQWNELCTDVWFDIQGMCQMKNSACISTWILYFSSLWAMRRQVPPAQMWVHWVTERLRAGSRGTGTNYSYNTILSKIFTIDTQCPYRWAWMSFVRSYYGLCHSNLTAMLCALSC